MSKRVGLEESTDSVPGSRPQSGKKSSKTMSRANTTANVGANRDYEEELTPGGSKVKRGSLTKR